MNTERYNIAEPFIGSKHQYLAKFVKYGHSPDKNQKMSCLTNLYSNNTFVADHLWTNNNQLIKLHLRPGDTILFDAKLGSRKRPGPTIFSGDILDIRLSKLTIISIKRGKRFLKLTNKDKS